MNRFHPFRRVMAPILALALAFTLSLPASAFFWNKKESAAVNDFSKNGLIGTIISFSLEDFAVTGDKKTQLTAITIESLPDPGAGTLVIGGQPLQVGTVVDCTALDGLRFQSSPVPTVTTTTFTFTPSLAPTQDCGPVTITGYFDAVDSEGDALSFQLTSTPARGAVTLAEDGSSQFVYTPYENKTGSDSFTYVAVDPAGNTSAEAKITVHIEKADTKVTYADMEGNPAHKAAIRLAEEGIYVGQYMNGHYFFDPKQPVSRAQFLTMAIAVSGLEAMEGVTLTGFSDDSAIPTWAKGSVSAALKAGTIQGSKDESGTPVFGADTPITRAEATVMLNNLLDVTDVPVEVFSSDSQGHWASQAAANLASSGVIRMESTGAAALSNQLTRAEAAEMLDGAMDVLADREDGWLPW